jgi:hypothetical protein
MIYAEYEEQKQLIKWWRDLKTIKKIPSHYHLICTDTAAKRTIGQQIRYKAIGGESGTPDLFLALPGVIYDKNCYGLWIEMKKPDVKSKTGKGKGGVSAAQKKILCDLRDIGYGIVVCYSAIEAQKIINDYLGMKLI